MRADYSKGELGEKMVSDLLTSRLVNHEIVWTRKNGRTNQPFDFEVYEGGRCELLVEVKSFAPGRKWNWTQFKRPEIKRKKARAETLNCQRMITLVVDLMTKEIRGADGFPCQPFGAFSKMSDFVL